MDCVGLGAGRIDLVELRFLMSPFLHLKDLRDWDGCLNL